MPGELFNREGETRFSGWTLNLEKSKRGSKMRRFTGAILKGGLGRPREAVNPLLGQVLRRRSICI